MTMADISFTERQELRTTVRSFLARYSPEAEVRRQLDSADGFDRGLWARMAGELGLQGLAVPEEYGGSGFGLSELQVVQEEAGGSLLCGPLFSSAAFAASLLLATGDGAACAELLPRLCVGEHIAVVAATESPAGAAGAAGPWAAGGWQCRAESAPGGYTVTGRKDFVPDAQTADLLLVPAHGPHGLGVFAVAASDRRVQVTQLPSLDATRRLSQVVFDAAPARLLGKPDAGGDTLRAALVPACCALASELAGVARRALDIAVEYAKVRTQFGRVIGSFQAIKQKCADVLIAVEAASAAAYAAGLAYDSDSDEAAMLAHLALARAAEAAVLACTESVEVHGGIGFTWEHPAHLYYKRAIASSVLLGSATQQRAQLLTALGR